MGIGRLIFVVVAAMATAASAQSAKIGATLPWMTHEAEMAQTSGEQLGPAWTGRSAAREASGRQCVRLSQANQSITFTAKSPGQAIVIRYSIPDSPDGKGLDATLSWTINNQPQAKLKLTSRYAYLYGDYPFNNTPSSGSPRNFWDEVRVSNLAIASGDLITLTKSAGDAASEYVIDFIDIERVPEATQQPTGSVSVLEHGAKADDDVDDRAAFAAAIAAAKSKQESVWIPPGRFVIKGQIDVSDVALRGAGMWHTTLTAVDDYQSANRITINGVGSNIELADFAIIGKLNYRNDTEPNDGLGGSFGTGSIIRNIWVEHTKTGAWIVNSDGLQIEGCRFRNNIADGINLCVGMRNSLVRNCTARGTGDDCFAIWPATYLPAAFSPGHNRYIECTAQLPFLAQGFAVYGGESNSVEQCEASDIPYGAGLFASTTFPTQTGFTGTTQFKRIKLTRTGDDNGAIGTVANLLDLSGLRFENIEVIDSGRDAIRFTSLNGKALRDTVCSRIDIRGTGLSGEGSGVASASQAVGEAKLEHVSVKGARSSGWKAGSTKFTLVQGEGNSGLDAEASTPR